MISRFSVLVIAGLLLVAACAESESDDEDIASEPITTPEVTATEEREPSPTVEIEPTMTPTPDDALLEGDDDEIGHSDVEEPAEEEDSSSDDAVDDSDEQFGTVPDVYFDEFHDQALSELLLNESEMPEGWSVMVEGSLPGNAEATQGLGDMMSGPCGNELLTLEAMGNPVHVGRHFIGEGLGPFFSQDLYQFDDAESAMSATDLASAQLDCDDWTEEDPATGMEMQYSVEDLDFPELGDNAVAVSLQITSLEGQAGVQPVLQVVQFSDPLESLSAKTVLVRQGHILSSFTYLDWFGDGELNLEEVVTRAVEAVETSQ